MPPEGCQGAVRLPGRSARRPAGTEGVEVRVTTAGRNPYREQVQGKANQPITVLALLRWAAASAGRPAPEVTQAEVVDRLDDNAPRIAIIGGSADHPAHVAERTLAAPAALRVWDRGGVPFWFGGPVMCDGTAQSTLGMSYSLTSRNAAAEMIINQMEAQQYHAAFVIQGCDKTPFAAVCALGHLDAVRRARGDVPVHAVFAPMHVLRGGAIPPAARAELEALAASAAAAGHDDLAEDLRHALRVLLQCTATQAFQGILSRAVQAGLLTAGDWKRLEKELAANTCHPEGGICAFNGTGNSARMAVAALGLAHPALELLPGPPARERVDAAVDALFGLLGRPEYSVSQVVAANFANAVRVHSATGGSSNLLLHLVAAMVYCGRPCTVADYDAIRRQAPVPDLFDYSLTEGRDFFALAQQVAAGRVRGVETLLYELGRCGVPLDLDAPTVSGGTWRERLADARGLPAAGVRENPVLLSRPRRPVSGSDVLSGSFFESAVVKISGMTDGQLDAFDERVAFALYYENEETANAELLDLRLLERLRSDERFPLGALRRLAGLPAGREAAWDALLQRDALRLAVVIAGQGPRAFGMPEMFTPMQHINANRGLRRLAVLLSDGRYSGVTYGAAIGHVVPEAALGGGILALQTGDLVHLRLRARRIELLDAGRFAETGDCVPIAPDMVGRAALAEERLLRIATRRRQIAPANRMDDVTDAARGVVPAPVWRWAAEEAG